MGNKKVLSTLMIVGITMIMYGKVMAQSTIQLNNMYDLENKNIHKQVVSKQLAENMGTMRNNGISILNTVEKQQVNIENTSVKDEIQGYIFVGDSRFVGMNMTCSISDIENHYVIAEVGKGYNFFEEIALHKIEEIISENTEVEHWNFIIGLGVNDLDNIEKYIESYENFAAEHKAVYIVSVNPVEYHSYITNETIEIFNDALSKLENIHYINTFDYMIENGYNTRDGVHYTNETYENIYNYIRGEIE